MFLARPHRDGGADSDGSIGPGAGFAPRTALLLGALAVALPQVAAAATPPGPGELSLATSVRVPLRSSAHAPELVRRSFSLRGIPVRGAFETIAVDPAGGERRLAAVQVQTAPQVDPTEATIDAEELPALVADALSLAAAPQFEGPAALVYLMLLETPVLAWEAQLPLTRAPEPTRRTVWISAMTGRVLGTREQVRTARARVFAQNPSKTPTPIDVELPGITNAQPGAPLVGAGVTAFNCLAEPQGEPPGWLEEGDCFPAHVALADEDGNFYVPLPNVILEADNQRPSDAYAELSMYYHGVRFLELLGARGVEGFKCDVATMLANWRQLEPSGDDDYTPVNNAFWTNQCDAELGVSMLFGQGSDVDFAYDGDVIYHELGHGVVSLLTPEGLTDRRLRPDGAVVDAGALNEAIADYFGFMGTDDPRLAEYVGRFWTSNSAGQIRTGENTKRCPDDTVGQVHNDGEPVQAALWSARRQVGAQLDAVVLDALTRLPVDATLEEGAAAFLAAAVDLAERGELDSEAVPILDRALRTRGLFDCPRVVGEEMATAGRSMVLRRRTSVVQPFYPGPMQLRYTVPQGVESVWLTYTLRGREPNDPGALALVRRAQTPITFSYALVAADDPGDSTGEVGRIREVTLVEGDWDLEIEAQEIEDGSYVAQIPNVRAGDVLHVGLVSLSEAELTASDVKITANQPPRSDDAAAEGDASGGSGSDSDASASDRIAGQDAVTGGCGCQAPGRFGGAGDEGGYGLLLWAVALFRRRR